MNLDNKEAAQIAAYFYYRDKDKSKGFDFEMAAVERGIIQGIGVYSKIQSLEDMEVLKVLDVARAEIVRYYKLDGKQYSNILMLIDNLEKKLLK